jgi:type IX secretion system PorP/SprF family membrane protein
MRKRIVILFLLILAANLFFIVENQAQDIHFSQFYSTPLLTNSANTGISGEQYRFANCYRNQWAAIGTPLNTFYTSLDKKISFAGQSFGIGGTVIHDQASNFNMSADEFLVSFSYSKIIDNHQFSIAIQPGYVLKAYNTQGLTFGSQFDLLNEVFNTNLPSSEFGLSGNLHYFDFNAGIFWRTLIHNMMPSAGFSISHITRPLESFSNSSGGFHLPMKFTFNSQLIYPLNSRMDITPCMLYGFTPGAHELLLGSSGDYSVENSIFQVKKISALAMFRINPVRDIDAVILGGSINFAALNIGISYDINISPLARAGSFNGAFEVSLIYIGGNNSLKFVKEPCNIY